MAATAQHEKLDMEQVITLNVSGTIFQTRMKTLYSPFCRGSFFRDLAMKPEGEGKGYYFIDRNPEKFGPILDFLRTGVFDVRKRRHLMDEARFFGLHLDEEEIEGATMMATRNPTDGKWRFETCPLMDFEPAEDSTATEIIQHFRGKGFSLVSSQHYETKDGFSQIVMTR